MATDVADMLVTYRADLSSLPAAINTFTSGTDAMTSAAESSGEGITSAFQQAGDGLTSFVSKTDETTSALKTMSTAGDASKVISNVDVAQAQLTLLESKVTDAREKLQTLQNAADAGEAITGIPEAEAQLTLLEAKAQSARADLDQLIATSNETGSELAGDFSKAGAAATQFENDTEVAKSSFLGNLGSMASGITDFVGKLGMIGLGYQTVTGFAQSLYNTFLSGNASMEQTTTAFTQLLGSSKAANDELQKLQQFAASTPFDFPSLADSTQKLLAFQIPLKDTQPLLTAIGDSLSGLGKNTPATLDQVVQVFGQMNAAGKLQTQDLMQLTSVGINGFQLLATQMGKPVSTIKDMVSQGLIPATDGIQMLQKGMEATFGGGMQAQSATFNGLLSTLQDNANAALRAFSGPLFDAAKSGLTTLGNLVSSPAFQAFATNAGKQIATIFGNIGSVLKDDVGPAWEKFDSEVLHDEAGGIFIGIFQNIGDILSNLGGIVEKLTPGFQTFTALFKNVDVKSGLVDAVSGLETAIYNVSGVVQDATDNIQKFSDWLNQASVPAQIFKDLVVGIGAAFAAFQIASFLATVPALVVAFVSWATAAGAAAIATIAATWPILAIGAAIAVVVAGILLAIQNWGAISAWLQNAWSGVVSFFQGIWSKITGFFSGIGQWFHDRFTEAGNGIQSAWQGTQNFFNGVGKWFQDRGTDASKGWQTGMSAIGDANQAAMQKIVDGFNWMYNHNYYFKDAVDAIKQWNADATAWLQNAWSTATTWLSNTWNTVATFASNTWSAVYNTISSWITQAVNWISDQWNTITGWLSAQWQIISGYAIQYWNLIYSTISAVITQVVTWIQTQWNTATTWLSDQWNKLASLADTAWKAVSGVFSSIWNTYLAGPLNSVWTQITGWFSTLATGARNSGVNFINMLVDGISSGAGAVWDAVVNIATQIWNALGFHSPAKAGPGSDADTWMPNLVKMLSSGLTAGAPQIAAATMQAAQPLTQFAYPVQPSPALIASAATPAQQGANGSGQTFIFQTDGIEQTRIQNKNTARIVNLKLGAKGRHP